MNIVRTSPPRVARNIASAFASCGVTTVHEAQGRRGLLQSCMRPIYAGARAVGTAVTVSIASADSWMIHVAVAQCREGDILVVAPTSPSDAGYFGELLACSLAARGVVGLVIEAGCRDVAALAGMRFPVWSKAISAQGTVKETLGAVNAPIVCAGQLMHPGDLLNADGDGVVAVRRAEAEQVLRASEARERMETTTRARLQVGKLGFIYAMRETLARKGLRYEDASGG